MDTTTLILLLSSLPGLGEKKLAAILAKNALFRRSPTAFFALGSEILTEEYLLPTALAERITRVTTEERNAAQHLAKRLGREQVRVVTQQDATYPGRLLQSLDVPPPVLYLYGNSRLLDPERSLYCVANSNDASEEILAACDRRAEEAIASGSIPVTGHNRLPYQRTALVACRRNAPICYVLDRGLYTAFNGDLSRELFPAAHIWSPAYDPERDLTLTPFPPLFHSLGTHNRRRDELIFALSDVVYQGDVRPGGQMERRCSEARAVGKTIISVKA